MSPMSTSSTALKFASRVIQARAISFFLFSLFTSFVTPTFAQAQELSGHHVDVLILTGPGGHNLAAANLMQRLNAEGLTYALFDFSSLSAWTFEETLELLDRDPESANTFYREYYERAAKTKNLYDLPQGEWHNNDQFMSVLNLVKPGVILSTYAIANETISRLEHDAKMANIPVGLCITDYHPNRYWTYQIPQAATQVFAPSKKWAQISRKYGTPASKITEAGILGNPRSEETLTPAEVDKLWESIGFDQNITTIKISGGSGGVGTFGKMLESIRSEFEKRPDKKLQVLFATGSNKKSFDEVMSARDRMPPNVKITALGFTPLLPHYENYVADIDAEKAGGLTTTQVARSRGVKNGKMREGRPLLLFTPSYGIEDGNSSMFFAEKMARPTQAESLGKDIMHLMDHPEVQEEMMKNQGQIRDVFHPERILAWTKKMLKRNTKLKVPFIATENTRWITEKLNFAATNNSKPILTVSDQTVGEMVEAGRNLSESFEKAKAIKDAKIEKRRQAELRRKYPVRAAAEDAVPFEISITVDDLPIGAGGFPEGERRKTLQKMIEIFQGHGIKSVYGFVNSANLEGWTEVNEMLQDWRKAGFQLGNHTHSHPSLTATSAQDYIRDVEKADQFLAHLGVPKEERRVFRYPFLEEGNNPAKRKTVLSYLEANGYRVAPVTVDSQDYRFNASFVKAAAAGDVAKREMAVNAGITNARKDLALAEKLSKQVFGRNISHVLLLHLASINIESLDQILGEYEARGAKFVSVDKSLQDPVYKINHGQSADAMMSFVKEMAYASGYWTNDDENRTSTYKPATIQRKISRSCEEEFGPKDVMAELSNAG